MNKKEREKRDQLIRNEYEKLIAQGDQITATKKQLSEKYKISEVWITKIVK